jgi:adenylylsulfate kinase
LAARLDAHVIDKDAVRDAIFPPVDVDYSAPQNALATEVMLMVARYILTKDAAMRVILDGKPFSRQDERDAARSVAQQTGSAFCLIHCVTEDEVARRRLAHDLARDPRNVAGDRTFDKYQRIKAAFEPIREPHLVLNTDGTRAAAVTESMAYLQRIATADGEHP